MTHPQSLLAYVLEERHDFLKNKFPAIIDYPKNMDLWKEFEDIYKTYVPTKEEIDAYENATEALEAPNVRAAMKFYYERKEKMEEGSRVLWESRFPLPMLFIEKLSIGNRAFSTEFQNIPYDKEDMLFDPDEFFYYDYGMTFPNNEYTISMGIDWSMGKERGDFSAITVLAQHKGTKKIYVADSYLKRVHPDVFISDIVSYVMKYQPDTIASEAQMMQEFATDQLKKQLTANGYPAYLRVKNIQQRQRKELRIEAMLPDIQNGSILFNKTHGDLLLQFEQFGLGVGKSTTHDDGPDSMATALMGLKNSKAKIMKKSGWM